MASNTNLGNTPVSQGYTQLFHTGETGGLTSTLQQVFDGDGTGSDLYLATNKVKIGTAGNFLIGSSTIQEFIQDIVGDMFDTNGSHTNITATYDDNGDGAIDLNATGAISGLTEGTGVTITGTTNKTIAIGQSVGTSDSVTFGRVNLGSTDTSSFLTGDPKISATGYMMIQGIINETETGSAPAGIVFGNNSTYGNDEISLITAGQNRLFINSSGNITISQDLTISGDLQVNGTTTTINQTNLDVSDNIIGLNRGLTGASANDSGLIIERGTTGDNVFIGYDESLGTSGRVRFATTTALPNATGALSFSASADIHAGRLFGDVTGNVTGSASLNLLISNNLSDLANAGTARTNLGVDPAGTDNSTPVTLAGSRNYITAGGTDNQTLTLGQIDISDDTNLVGGTGITLTGDTLSTTDSEIVHDNLSGYEANEHKDHSAINITTGAGSGLNGGGNIASSRSLSLNVNNLDAQVPALTLSDKVAIYDTDPGETNVATLTQLKAIVNTDTNTNQLTTFDVSGDSGTDQTISHGNTLTISGGNGITTATSATDILSVALGGFNSLTLQSSPDSQDLIAVEEAVGGAIKKVKFGTFSAGISFNGSTANGLLTYGNSTTADVESELTYTAGTLKLERATGNAVFRIQSNDSNPRIYFNEGNTTRANLGYSISNNRFELYADGNTPFSIEDGAGSNTLVVDSNSRVGIGTASPSYLLHLSGTAPELAFTDTDGSATWRARAVTNNFHITETGAGDPFVIESGAGADALRVRTTGVSIPATNKLYLDGGTHTYIDEVASDQLRLVAGGTEILKGYASGTIDIYGSNINRSIELGANRTGDGASFIDFIGDTTYTDYGFRVIRNSGATGITQLLHRGTGELQLTTQESAPIRFRTGGSDALMINSSQNVGLKATGKLFFDGVDSSGDTYIFEESGNNILHYAGGRNHMRFNSTGAIFNDAGLAIDFRVEGDTEPNLLFVDGDVDRIGIGTNSPTSLLTTSGGDIRILGSGNRLRFNTNGSIYWDNSVGVKLENASTENITIETNTSGDIKFNTANTGTMVLTDDKEVFIGETTQNQNLAFGGTLKTHQYLDTRDYMQHKGHFAESDWIVMESGANHVVTSYFDNTNVYVDGVYKAKIDSAFGQATISSADLSLGSVISADRAVIVHQSGTIRSMCMNTRFSGKLLGSASTRGYPLTIHIYAPYTSVSYSIYRSSDNNTNVDLSATALTTGTISQGGIISFTESDTASGNQHYVIEADGKVCATLDDGAQDHLLFTPLAMEVIASSFSRENRGGVTTGVAEDSTNISETANGNAYYLKDTSGKYGLFATGVADGAGSEAEFAMPIEFCSDYYIYGDPELSNYRLVCFQDTFVKVLDVSGNVLYTHDASSATKNAPLYFDNGTATGSGTLSTAGPFRFVGTAPFYLVCQEPGGQDEATMLGAMQHELSNNQRFKGGYVPNATTIDANLVVNDSNFTLFADSANNKVGIGESSLDANLHISGSPVVLKMDRVGTRAMRMGVPDNSSDFVFADSDDLKSNQRLELTGAGDVYVVNDLGVGVASPGAKLHVDEDDNVGAFLVKGGGGGTYLGRFQRDVGGTAYVDIHCGSDDPQITFTDSGASRQFSIGADSSFNGFKIAENSSIGTNDRFGINDAGQVLVGTSISNRSSVAGYAPIFQTEASGASGYVQIVDSENSQFHGGSLALHKYRSGGIVANTELGSIWFGGTDSANSTFAQGALIRAYAEGADSGSNVATNVRFFTNTGSAVTEAMRIESDQDVHFDQDVIAFSTTPSDKRLKTNINDINYGLDTIMKLSPKEYDWKKDNRHDIGFIAQEVEEVIPEIVKDKKHFDRQIKTLDYEKLTAVLIKAVQEQQEEINKLKEKLNG